MPGLTQTLKRKSDFEGNYRSLDFAFRVRANDAEFGAILDQFLAPFRTAPEKGVATYDVVSRPPTRTKTAYNVYRGGKCVHRSDWLATALDFLVWQAADNAIEATRQYLALHASAASSNGIGIVLPAPSGSGKSTMVAALVRAGFAYLTDEYALIDMESGALHPFPKALWMAPESLELVGLAEAIPESLRKSEPIKYFLSPEKVRPTSIGDRCRVGFVVFPEYVGGQTKLEPVSRAEAIYELAENSFNFDRLGAPALDVLARVVRDADCYRLRIGDLGEAVSAVRGLVDRNGSGR